MAKWERIQLEGGSQWVRVARYRLMSFRKPLAPWRATLAEAERDALDLRVASRSGKQVYLTVPAWIRESDPTPETEAGLRAYRPRRLVEVAEPRCIKSHP